MLSWIWIIWNYLTKSRFEAEYNSLEKALNELDCKYDINELISIEQDDLISLQKKSTAEGTTPIDNKDESNYGDDDWIVSENMPSTEEARQMAAEGKAMHKTFAGFINSNIYGEITIQPSGLKFKLCEVECNFIPMTGDNVALKTICLADPYSKDLSGKVVSMEALTPLRSRLIEGRISIWKSSDSGMDGWGEITPIAMNGERCYEQLDPVYFERSNCEAGYIPHVGDRVSADCIESHREDLQWRALIVVSLTALATKRKIVQHPEEIELLNAKGSVDISKQAHIGTVQFGETKFLQVQVSNFGDVPAVLKAVYPHPKLCTPRPQFSIDKDFPLPVTINADMHIFVNFCCNARNLGASRELFVFEFEGCQCFGRYLEAEVLAEFSTNSCLINKPNRTKLHHHWRPQDSTDGPTVAAPRRGNPLDPFRKRLPRFELPRNARDLAKDPAVRMGQMAAYDALHKYFKDFRNDLSPDNYARRWHDLLYIEEAEISADMQKFDITDAQLEPINQNGPDKLYSLKVPGLTENRPSLVMNDTVEVVHTKGGTKFEGVVSKVMLSQVQLRFSERFETPGSGDTYYVRFKLNRNPYRRLHSAVDAAWTNLGPQLLFPSTKITFQRPQIFLEDFLTAEEKAAVAQARSPMNNSLNSHSTSGYRRGSYRGRQRSGNPQRRQSPQQNEIIVPCQTMNICYINDKLNSSQRAAVRNVLLGRARPLPYIIYGPPGTGKTMTLVETILQLHIHLRDSRILVATPSNSAADLLAERLLDSGKVMPGEMVRLIAFCYEDNLTPRLIPYSRVLKGLGELQSRDQTLIWERIVIGTCSTLAKLVQNCKSTKDTVHFTHVVVDEAGQTMEPETMLVTALLGKPKQTILAGDPMQLGPVVQGRASELSGLGVSFLGRLLNQGPYRRDVSSFPDTQGYNPNLVTMLVQNYRSVPEILALPATLFYNSELVATVSQHQGVEATLLATMKDELPSRPNQGPPALVFHGVRGHCDREFDSPSWYNDIELFQSLQYITALYRAGLSATDIGIISPYNKQVQKMRKLLYTMQLSVPKIGSVEEFQGQERFAIIFSAVRSAENCGDEGLGFLSNPNRMNTAITRARALLVVIGDPHLLALDPSWRSLIVDCLARKAYCGCDVPSCLIAACAE